jgi:hypothetical protein
VAGDSEIVFNMFIVLKLAESDRVSVRLECSGVESPIRTEFKLCTVLVKLCSAAADFR